MLENLAYCLNATAPIFLLMLLGLVFRRLGFFSQAFADKLNDFVFKVGLPVMLFKDLVESDFFTVWDGPFVLFCFLATLGSILLTAALSLFCRERPLRGEFIQVGYRSSIALLGAAFLENLYGTAGAASLVIIGAVPLYNVAAVTVLSLTSPQQSGLNQAALKKALKGIVTNPIILGIAAGLVWTLLDIPQPQILQKTVSSLSATATPPGPHGPGRLLRSEEGPGPLEARLRRHRREAGASGRPLSPHRRGHGSTGRQAGGRPGHAGQPHHRQQLRHGPQHGA